jgi:hypothetical protein
LLWRAAKHVHGLSAPFDHNHLTRLDLADVRFDGRTGGLCFL